MKKKIYILNLFILWSLISYAQQERVANAISLVQTGEIDKAKSAIDSAIADPASLRDAEAWYVKGFVYKELYKKYEAPKKGLNFRTEAVQAFKKSLSIDTSAQNQIENKKNLKSIANTFFNDAATSLDTINHAGALKFYNLFKETMLIADPAYRFVKKDIEFKLALASLYTKIYERDRKKNESFFSAIKQLYSEILAVDPNNVSANYNMGILFYNQAVNIIKEMDYDVDIFELGNTQDHTVVLFKESLPYMEKAYQLDPKRKETLIGLSGIYFSLNEEEKSKAFKEMLDLLENPK